MPHTAERPTAVVVNDEPSQLRLTAAVLENAGLRVYPCLSVEEALRAMHEGGRTDIVVTDLHMPGIDGWRFCQLLRSPEYAAFNRTPILVVSATFSGCDAEQMTRDLGADGFLAAPYAPSVLQDYVREILDGRAPRPSTHVLLVEPDPALAATLQSAFEARGHIVTVAGSSAEGLQLCGQHRPDIAVINDRPPEVDAERLLERITRPGSRMVALLVTGEQSAGKILRLTSKGADGYLRPPLDPAQVVERCEQMRRQRSLMRVEELLEQRTRALRDSETRWRSLFESIPQLVLVHDDDGVVRHINRVGAERLGWPEFELIGRNVREFEHPHFRTGPPEGAPDGSHHCHEATYVTRTGQEIDVEVAKRRIQFEGKPAILSVAHDVTAQHELGRQRANFLAMVTHDIKNPLAVILGFASMLSEIGELSPEQQDIVMRMQASADTVLSLVANYLNLTKIEAGSLALSRRPLALNQLLQSIGDQYGGEAQRQGIAFEQDLAPDLPTIEADELALERAFSNLVHNAVKFTPANGRVTIRSAQKDGQIVVQVQDSGCGISPEDLPSIFQPYRRGETRQAREGTGLGLCITKTLVEAHGGRITVDSTPGRGTCFSISLPIRVSD